MVHRGGTSSSATASGREEGESEAGDWGSGTERDPDCPDRYDGYENKGEDSKSLRLSLMEEVLLLGIKDREVPKILNTACFTSW